MSSVASSFTLIQWLADNGYQHISPLQPITGDAGFRQYFRFSYQGQSFLAVDAPPQYCNNQAFHLLATNLKQQHINVPKIWAYAPENGYFCIEDFGNTLLADVLFEHTMSHWYQKAIAILPNMMTNPIQTSLPTFDANFIQTELNIFTQWLCDNYLSLKLSEQENKQLQACFSILIDNALAQPQVFMHRDFHSRNLMVLADDSLGVIDFQDAVKGPITYDIVSLLRDCYMRWPADKIDPLLSHFIQQVSGPLSINEPLDTWQRWFDLMGLQRHIKASGIFARLKLRDNKPGYIKDIPLTLRYIVDIAAKYDELHYLSEYVNVKVLPAVERINK